ncbi:Actin-2 [Candida maltosa Xu316]
MSETLYNQPVVIDNGSGNLKAGFAGEEKPKTFASAIIGRPKYQKIMAAEPQDQLYIGNSAQENRGLLKISYPIEHGIVNNWSDMEKLWYHTYTHDLKIQSEEHPLLITEAPLNPRSNRNKMCQILFENFNIPCIYISIQAVLSLYASGRTTGVVIDSGDGVSHIVPVYEGFSLPPSIKRMDIAGRDITESLSFNIRRMSGISMRSSSEMEIVRLIKEQCCFISKDPARDEKGNNQSSDLFSSYKLPDGHEIQLGVERFRAPEILFNPQLIGDESPGLHELTSLSIAKTDLDLRSTLYQNIILSGGNTLLKNFGDRMLKELKDLQQPQQKVKIYAPPERKYSTWIGGSILAGLSTFKKMWVTSEEYHENPDIIHVKCM